MCRCDGFVLRLLSSYGSPNRNRLICSSIMIGLAPAGATYVLEETRQGMAPNWGWARMVLVLSVVLVVLVGCRHEPSFDESERRNAQGVVSAMSEVRAAVRLTNRSGAGIASEREIQQLRLHYARAYDLARDVEDPVLDKIHEDLREHWRDEFQEAARLMLKNLTEGDLDAALKGPALHGKWIDWLNANRREMKIPCSTESEPC